jgi:hypothetical protein
MSFVAEHWVSGRLRPMIAAVIERPDGTTRQPDGIVAERQ